MNKVLPFLIIFIAALHPKFTFAQSKTKAENQFVQELNAVLKKSIRHESTYVGALTIDSSFVINKEGILAVTLRYRNDTTFKRVRLQAPVAAISTVRYDLYLILEFKDDVVTLYESEPGTEILKETGKGSWFHVGAPLPEDVVYQQRIQKALDKLKKYY